MAFAFPFSLTVLAADNHGILQDALAVDGHLAVNWRCSCRHRLQWRLQVQALWRVWVWVWV